MALIKTANPLEYNSKINGLVYGYTDITLTFSPAGQDGIQLPFYQVPELNYTWTNDGIQELGGTSPLPIGYTAGHLTLKGSFTISLEENAELMSTIVRFAGGLAGVSRVPFDIQVDYGPISGVTKTGETRFLKDIIFGCRLTDGDSSHSRTGGALMVKHNFVFTNLSVNDLSMI